MKKFTYLILLSISILFLNSCKKVEEALPEDPPVTEQEDPTNHQPRPGDADAVLVALQTVTYISVGGTTIETALGMPIAIFLDGDNFKDVGAVSCEGESLDKMDNNSYIYMPSASNPLGVTYNGNIAWTIAGGNGFPAHSVEVKGSFPSNVEIAATTGEQISTASSYTLKTKIDIANADSVYFGIYGTKEGIMSVQPANVSSHTFSAAEMESIGKGTGYMQIAAVKTVKKETLRTGEVIYYMTEKVNTTSITLN